MKLSLGVLDVGYVEQGGLTTTGDVAEILEGKYHIMRVFFELYESKITAIIMDQMAGAIESRAQGGPGNFDFRQSMGKIEAMFRDFLDADEMSRILPETYQVSEETRRSSNRRKNNKPDPEKDLRPAFVDTGLFQQAFKAWITTNGNT